MFKKKKVKEEEPQPTPPGLQLFSLGLVEGAKVSDPNWIIPKPLKICIDYLNKNGLSWEGLYRIPGSVAKINEYVAKLDRGDDIVWESPYECAEACGIIFKYLQRIPDDLFSREYRSAFNKAIASENVEAVKGVLRKMSLTHRECLRVTVEHLAKVAANAEKTKMTAETIGICWGPSFAKTLPFLISHCDTIFPNTIVFGIPFAEAAKRSDPNGLIPAPIGACIAFLDKHLDEELLWRQSGSVNRIKEIIYALNSGDYDIKLEPGDAHNCTGVVLSFFRDCPDRLFTPKKKIV